MKSRKKIISVVGARPNFIKMAPLYYSLLNFKNQINHKICHTGQHFDKKMSNIFFGELEIPKPDFNLSVQSGSHSEQTAKIMTRFEKVLIDENPDLVVVFGDVNSTLAASIVAKKLNIDVAHVESGLRSFDMKMPEEINRIITDSISDILFVSEQSGIDNLKNEGKSKNIFHTGNIMIDSLVKFMPKIDNSNIINKLGLKNDYLLVTFHRPSNVDDKNILSEIVKMLFSLSNNYQIVFPVHPRTKKKLQNYKLLTKLKNVILLPPLGYIDFLSLTKNSKLIITDSGGIQEESTFLKVPCITVRENTERPSTCEIGSNKLMANNFKKISEYANSIMTGKKVDSGVPDLWDGKSADRISSIIVNFLFKTE
tara:strand:+ start:829 stop:1932 length:1104 start_codon:yes stop_codon:yes gene_type:complete